MQLASLFIIISELKFEQKIWRQFGFGSQNRTQLLGGESGDEALQDLEGGG